MTAAMLLQSKLTPMTATGAQQKMLTYGMPLMFGVMGFFFPAGLSLYISTNTVLTLLHHLYMRRSAEREGERKPVVVDKTEPVVSGRKASGGKSVEIEVAAEAGDDEDGDAGDEAGSKASANGRNGQQPRGPNRGNRPGKRGGRRKRTSKSS
jgi:membrane protein insertase Oxa1/YidC/SpoIIIJ